MRALERLDLVCERADLTLALYLVGPTGHPATSSSVWPDGELRLRVLREGEIIAGRAQSEPGRETIDDLAEACLVLLRRRGVVGA